jgi:hypothetical protein
VYSNANKATRDVAKEILSYFLRYPQASDNLIGIARWRLMQETVRHSVEQTSDALEWLIAEGYLQEEKHFASARIFRLNAHQRKAAEEFLRRGSRGVEESGGSADGTQGIDEIGRES